VYKRKKIMNEEGELRSEANDRRQLRGFGDIEAILKSPLFCKGLFEGSCTTPF
jgi:hypothetical protein